MFLLDTNVVSELRKTRPHGAVVAWIRSVPEAVLHVSVITLREMQAGADKTRQADAEKADEIEGYIDQCISMFRVVDLDANAARLTARLMHRRSDDLYDDAMIAATALVHRLTVVTRNRRDFVPFEVPTLDPFKR